MEPCTFHFRDCYFWVWQCKRGLHLTRVQVVEITGCHIMFRGILRFNKGDVECQRRELPKFLKWMILESRLARAIRHSVILEL